jgi:hypothetical protein
MRNLLFRLILCEKRLPASGSSRMRQDFHHRPRNSSGILFTPVRSEIFDARSSSRKIVGLFVAFTSIFKSGVRQPSRELVTVTSSRCLFGWTRSSKLRTSAWAQSFTLLADSD